jgi:hypothetical protein
MLLYRRKPRGCILHRSNGAWMWSTLNEGDRWVRLIAHTEMCHVLHTETDGNRASGRRIDVACPSPQLHASALKLVWKTSFCSEILLAKKCFLKHKYNLLLHNLTYNLIGNFVIFRKVKSTWLWRILHLVGVGARNSYGISVGKSLWKGHLACWEGDGSMTSRWIFVRWVVSVEGGCNWLRIV